MPPHLDDPALTQRCDIAASGGVAAVPEFGDLGRWHIPGYELLEQIGQGGFGRVFKARQHQLARLVAVKLIESSAGADRVEAERFQAEAMAVARLHHENVVVAHDFGQAGDRLYLVMELLDGEDLGHRIRNHGPLDERSTWLVIRQAAAGLAHAAACGLVHRDVKPANLFLTPAPPAAALPPGVPLVKVTDFGLAITTDPGDGPHKGDGLTIGTPSYMAPEQARGTAVDHRADIYSLGRRRTALTGRPPFEGRTLRDMMKRKGDHTPPPLAAALRHSAELIHAMMHPDPDRRVQGYEELIARIDQLPVPTPDGVGRPSRNAPSGWWLVVAVVAVVALLAAVVWGNVRRGGREQEQELPAVGEYASDGAQDALFDGRSLDGWSVAGGWSADTDEEGTPVLVGSGALRRQFADHPDYRLTVGLDLYEASAAEVQFAIPSTPEADRRLVLRVTREGGAVFGTRDGDRGAFRPASPAVAFPSANWLKGRRPYLEVRVERGGGVWSVWFHGEPITRVPDDGDPKLPEFRLAAFDGPARVDTVVLERLHPVER